MKNKEEDEEEEEERREAAIASTPSLQPDFKPKSCAISQSQLSKFQVLVLITTPLSCISLGSLAVFSF